MTLNFTSSQTIGTIIEFGPRRIANPGLISFPKFSMRGSERSRMSRNPGLIQFDKFIPGRDRDWKFDLFTFNCQMPSARVVAAIFAFPT